MKIFMLRLLYSKNTNRQFILASKITAKNFSLNLCSRMNKIVVNRSICIASDGTSRLYWRNPD